MLLIAAVEKYNNVDFGGRTIIEKLATFFQEKRLVSIWRQDALLPLLAIQG